MSYKGTCHVILLAKLHDMYFYKTATFPHQPSLFKVFPRSGCLTQVSLCTFKGGNTVKVVFASGLKGNNLFSSRKHAYIMLTPLNPTFIIVKLGFTGVYTIFLISTEKHRLWVLVRTASLRRFYQVPTIYALSRNLKNIRIFI